MRPLPYLTEHEDAADLHFKLAYGCAFLSMVTVAACVYAYRGVLVVMRVVAYLTSLATVSISLKLVYTRHSFNFPKFVSFIHFVSTIAICLAILCYQRVAEGKTFRVPAIREFSSMLLPTAITFALSVGASNLALLHANASFVEMIGCCTPACVVLVSVSMGQRLDRRLLMPVIVVCMGIAMCVKGEIKFSYMGFMLAFGACILRAVKSTLQGFLLDSHGSIVLEPLELLTWISVPSLGIMLLWSLMTEGMEPCLLLLQGNRTQLLLDIGLTCIIACSLNILSLHIIQDLGVVGSQIAGQLKSILTIMGSVAVLGETVSLVQVCGFTCVLSGVLWYNRVDASIRVTKPAAAQTPQEHRSVDENTRLVQANRSHDPTPYGLWCCV